MQYKAVQRGIVHIMAILIILVAGGIVIATYLLGSLSKTEPNPTPQTENEASKNENRFEVPSADCGIYHDAGYMAGLYNSPLEEISDIPDECEGMRDQGWQEGRESAAKQFSQAYDTRRRENLLTITGAIYQYASENNGYLPGTVAFPTEPTCIGSSPECFDLANAGIIPTYLIEMPLDPENGSDENTGYTIHVKATGRIEASAVSSQNPGQNIIVER